MASSRALLRITSRRALASPVSRRRTGYISSLNTDHLKSVQLPGLCGHSHPLPRASATKTVERPFSVTSTRTATIVKTNPRKDDDGNDMLIEITSRAAKRLHEIMIQDEDPAMALRVTVQSGGCHGFQYLMSLASAREASPEDDTIFEADDGSGAKVIMDEPSLELLKGSQVDYTMELIGSQFKIVGNPAASSSCGCGTSFDIKP